MSEPSGIQSTVTFPSPVDCPLSDLSRDLDTTIRTVRTSIPPPGETPTVLEFVLPEQPSAIDGVETVFHVGDGVVCRVVHDAQNACPCTCLGEHQTPISRIQADRGDLTFVFHSPDFDRLQAIMQDLTDRFPAADIRRMIRAPRDPRPDGHVILDIGMLTDRQLEMLEAAHARGYFERPRGANATELAEEFGIDPSTFREHLTVGLDKILEGVLVTDARPSDRP